MPIADHQTRRARAAKRSSFMSRARSTPGEESTEGGESTEFLVEHGDTKTQRNMGWATVAGLRSCGACGPAIVRATMPLTTPPKRPFLSVSRCLRVQPKSLCSSLTSCSPGCRFSASRGSTHAGISSMERPEALILIPAFNEAAVIGDVIRQIRAVNLPIRYQILVIDDGSTDGTADVARPAGARAVSLIENLGYGYALRTGYQVALEEGVEIVIQLDGDGQHAPESIKDLLV